MGSFETVKQNRVKASGLLYCVYGCVKLEQYNCFIHFNFDCLGSGSDDMICEKCKQFTSGLIYLTLTLIGYLCYGIFMFGHICKLLDHSV